MDRPNGIWHKTSIQLAQEQSRTYSTTSIAGQKRSFSDTGTEALTRPAAPGPRSDFQRARSLPARQAALTASAIRPVEAQVSEYSQRRAFPSTPTATSDPLLSLSHPSYGLPECLASNFISLGINSIYPWQKSCLLGPGLLDGSRNLVYSAPTGGGKSLVADVLMLKRVLGDKNAKAILVLPYVALVQEKVRWLRRIVEGLPKSNEVGRAVDDDSRLWRKRADENTVRVVGVVGGSSMRHTFADFDIAVCTIEKANSLINAAINDCTVTNLRAVVMDELHMIDDDNRGYLLELLATKLLSLENPVQIVGMSATLSNTELLARWLRGHYYETGYRPIPIEEHLVYSHNIFPAGRTSRLVQASQVAKKGDSTADVGNAIATIAPSTHPEFKDPVLNAVVSLAHETAKAGYGALVFAGSRGACEADARWISRVMPGEEDLDPVAVERRLDLLSELRSLSTGLDPILAETIPLGVGFHHAGLTSEERDLIAEAYDAGTLKVCVATATLAAGINLPARRVVLHHARMGRDFIGPSLLRQMRGRAGRKGKDEIGETYLCCKPADLEAVVDLLQADIPEAVSCLNTENRRIQRAILEAIAIRLAVSRATIDEYMANSFMYHTRDHSFIQGCVESTLTELDRMGFITLDAADNFEVTRLGQAIVAAALDPDDGEFIHRELSRALQAFVLDGEMHVLYTFTPVNDFNTTVNWQKFQKEMERMDESGFRVLGLLGLKPTIVNRLAMGGTLRETTPEEKVLARVYRRFYLAFQLRDLCNEVPVYEVARKYDMPRGSVQNLAQTCHSFAAGIIKFCEQMGWGALAAALDHFSDRLRAGAKSDLLSLTKVTFIKSRTARVFWENGFKSVASLANSDPKDLLPILMQAQPHKIRLKGADNSKYRCSKSSTRRNDSAPRSVALINIDSLCSQGLGSIVILNVLVVFNLPKLRRREIQARDLFRGCFLKLTRDFRVLEGEVRVVKSALLQVQTESSTGLVWFGLRSRMQHDKDLILQSISTVDCRV